MDAPKPPEQVQLRVTWHGLEQHPAMAANSFLLQQSGQEFILSLGFAAFPFFEKPEEAATIKTVASQVIARVAMTPGRAGELMRLLQQGIEQWQAQQKH